MSSDPGDPDDESAALRARLDRLKGDLKGRAVSTPAPQQKPHNEPTVELCLLSSVPEAASVRSARTRRCHLQRVLRLKLRGQPAAQPSLPNATRRSQNS